MNSSISNSRAALTVLEIESITAGSGRAKYGEFDIRAHAFLQKFHFTSLRAMLTLGKVSSRIVVGGPVFLFEYGLFAARKQTCFRILRELPAGEHMEIENGIVQTEGNRLKCGSIWFECQGTHLPYWEILCRERFSRASTQEPGLP